MQVHYPIVPSPLPPALEPHAERLAVVLELEQALAAYDLSYAPGDPAEHCRTLAGHRAVLAGIVVATREVLGLVAGAEPTAPLALTYGIGATAPARVLSPAARELRERLLLTLRRYYSAVDAAHIPWIKPTFEEPEAIAYAMLKQIGMGATSAARLMRIETKHAAFKLTKMEQLPEDDVPTDALGVAEALLQIGLPLPLRAENAARDPLRDPDYIADDDPYRYPTRNPAPQAVRAAWEHLLEVCVTSGWAPRARRERVRFTAVDRLLGYPDPDTMAAYMTEYQPNSVLSIVPEMHREMRVTLGIIYAKAGAMTSGQSAKGRRGRRAEPLPSGLMVDVLRAMRSAAKAGSAITAALNGWPHVEVQPWTVTNRVRRLGLLVGFTGLKELHEALKPGGEMDEELHPERWAELRELAVQLAGHVEARDVPPMMTDLLDDDPVEDEEEEDEDDVV